ncbi:hypothetical protein GCM10025734_16630 [Kitasatospora paranensis]|uniref:CBS domain-containing protein n=1 Tax=Kitasatospora paranensis TaxID=258053 RepID=UPI0031EB8BD3
MRIADLMITPPVTVPLHATARHAAARMAEQSVGCVLVTGPDGLHGVLTDRDLALRTLAAGLGPDTPVSGLMSAPVTTVDAADDLGTAYRTFRRTGVRRLPVLGGGRLVGLLSVDDLFLDVLQRLEDLLGPLSWSTLREGAAGPAPRGRRPTT